MNLNTNELPPEDIQGRNEKRTTMMGSTFSHEAERREREAGWGWEALTGSLGPARSPGRECDADRAAIH